MNITNGTIFYLFLESRKLEASKFENIVFVHGPGGNYISTHARLTREAGLGVGDDRCACAILSVKPQAPTPGIVHEEGQFKILLS